MTDGAGSRALTTLLVLVAVVTLASAVLTLGSAFPRLSDLLPIPLVACATLATLSLFRRDKANVNLVAILLLACGAMVLLMGMEVTWPPMFLASDAIILSAQVEARVLGVLFVILAAIIFRLGRKLPT